MCFKCAMKNDTSWRRYFEIFEISTCSTVMKKKYEWNRKKLVSYGLYIYISWMSRLNKTKRSLIFPSMAWLIDYAILIYPEFFRMFECSSTWYTAKSNSTNLYTLIIQRQYIIIDCTERLFTCMDHRIESFILNRMR